MGIDITWEGVGGGGVLHAAHRCIVVWGIPRDQTKTMLHSAPVTSGAKKNRTSTMFVSRDWKSETGSLACS